MAEMAGKGGQDSAGIVSVQFDLMGQKLTAGHTMTPALVDRDLRGNYMAFKNTKVYLDSVAGSLGSTGWDSPTTDSGTEPTW